MTSDFLSVGGSCDTVNHMKISPLKWALRAAIWIWFIYWITQIFIGDLGASPALELNHKLGTLGLAVLSANLVLGALLDLIKPAPKWIRFWLSERRFWGVSAFLMLTVHVFFYFVNEGFEAKAWAQMTTKTYLIFATLAMLILLVLTATSNDYSLRQLGGKTWKRLHRTVYIAQILLFGHILLIEKADLVFYGIWLGILLLLQFARIAVRLLGQRRTLG